jgi:hypothetical protein
MYKANPSFLQILTVPKLFYRCEIRVDIDGICKELTQIWNFKDTINLEKELIVNMVACAVLNPGKNLIAFCP